MSGFIFGGAGGFRTHVQTKDSISFYMLIIMLFSKEDRRDDSNTSSYLVCSRLFSQEINKSILNLLCLRLRFQEDPKRDKSLTNYIN